ncbi:ferredoxin reductase [Baekduia alba]|uniref:ferredoxin reductase n=1 Tax=Baekduia alba TaxID=2997333 RepID=UPI00233FEA46|nr:ferredoxin reductase [Baekduia alba]
MVDETAHARTLALDVPGWPGHHAGQHLDVRLTAEDGYQAERSYSIASAPEDARVALTIERIDDGEVSPYLAGDVVVGDAFEIRGPIGGHFTWRASDGGPVLLVGGGSGLVPLMAMLRHRARAGSRADARLLVSARTVDDLLYRDELERLASAMDGLSITTTLTRGTPDGWKGHGRRVDAAMLGEVGPAASAAPKVFVCGPTPFVEAVADELVALGHGAAAIHTERFGPTGG